MKTRAFLSSIAALVIAVSSATYADEIYKWTDDEGNVHYEDRPSEVYKEERMRFSYNRTDVEAVNQRVQAQRENVNARNEAKADKEAEKLTASESRAAAEEKAAKCEKIRAQLKVMLESPRVYRENEAGERNYLDDVQREEARAKAEALVKETCSP
jgi:Domain of unknown function (DUF4124)